MINVERVRYNLRRVRQTLKTFDNGPALLRQLASRDAADLEFRLDGLVVSCPNVAGARLAVYEVFADDTYRLSSTLSGLGKGPRVLDFGAHIGCFALAVMRTAPGAVVHSYEPSAATTQYLRGNVAANEADDAVTVWQEAVSNAEGVLRLFDHGKVSVHNGILDAGDLPTVEVPAVAFATALERLGGQADVVKVDIEGAEYAMVLKSDPGDWSSVQRVVMEYHGLVGHGWTELEEFFGDVGLRTVRREPTTPQLGLAWLSRDS